MSTPRSIRFDPRTLEALSGYTVRHPGLSASAAASLLVDEGLRMDTHPGVIFRDGPMGRRAVLIGGPDVWEAVRLVRAVAAAEPDLAGDSRLRLASDNSGVPLGALRTALDYYGEFPDEVDELVEQFGRAEQVLLDAQQRTRALLGT